MVFRLRYSVATWAFRRSPAFRLKVEECVREALTQPFGDPVEIAGIHARASYLSSRRRAAWIAAEQWLRQESAAQKDRGATHQGLTPMALAAGTAFSGALWTVSMGVAWMLKLYLRSR